MPSAQVFVGIDIAATAFTASGTPDRTACTPAQTFAQDPDDFARLERQLATTGVAPQETLLVLEATSSSWVSLAVHLHEAGYHVAVVNPMHLRNDARSLPRRGTTDALDAQFLAQFAADRQPAPWPPPPHVSHEVRQRLVTRDALRTTRQQLRNQRHALRQWPVAIASPLAHLEAVIKDLDARIATLDKELATVLKEGAWAQSATLLQTIPGIGPLTTAWLLVATLNCTTCPTAEALTAYAGLVPLPYESGSSVHKRARIGHRGHAQLRRVVYLARVVASRSNPPLKALDERLRAAGKPVKVARCAVARKLVHQAWAVVTQPPPFDPPSGAESPVASRQAAEAHGTAGAAVLEERRRPAPVHPVIAEAVRRVRFHECAVASRHRPAVCWVAGFSCARHRPSIALQAKIGLNFPLDIQYRIFLCEITPHFRSVSISSATSSCTACSSSSSC